MKINRIKINYYIDWINFYVLRRFRNLSDKEKDFIKKSWTQCKLSKNCKYDRLMYKILNT